MNSLNWISCLLGPSCPPGLWIYWLIDWLIVGHLRPLKMTIDTWHSQSQIVHSCTLYWRSWLIPATMHRCMTTNAWPLTCLCIMHTCHNACISVPDLHPSNDGQELRLFVSYCQICQPTFERPQYLIMLSLLSLHQQWFKQAIKTLWSSSQTMTR